MSDTRQAMLTLRGSNKTTVKEIWQQEAAPKLNTNYTTGRSFVHEAD